MPTTSAPQIPNARRGVSRSTVIISHPDSGIAITSKKRPSCGMGATVSKPRQIRKNIDQNPPGASAIFTTSVGVVSSTRLLARQVVHPHLLHLDSHEQTKNKISGKMRAAVEALRTGAR